MYVAGQAAEHSRASHAPEHQAGEQTLPGQLCVCTTVPPLVHVASSGAGAKTKRDEEKASARICHDGAAPRSASRGVSESVETPNRGVFDSAEKPKRGVFEARRHTQRATAARHSEVPLFVCMCLYTYICIYMYIYYLHILYIYIYMYVYIYTHTHTYTHTYAYVYVNVFMPIQHSEVPLFVCIVCIYMYMYIDR